MIFPIVTFMLAVATMVCALRVTSLPGQIVFSFWTVILTILTAQTSTDEAIEARRKRITAHRERQGSAEPRSD